MWLQVKIKVPVFVTLRGTNPSNLDLPVASIKRLPARQRLGSCHPLLVGTYVSEASRGEAIPLYRRPKISLSHFCGANQHAPAQELPPHFPTANRMICTHQCTKQNGIPILTNANTGAFPFWRPPQAALARMTLPPAGAPACPGAAFRRGPAATAQQPRGPAGASGHMAVGQNRFGMPCWGWCTTHFRTYFSGDWDVHWGYVILTHGHMGFKDIGQLESPQVLCHVL